jgi:Straboviridae tail sheath protein
MILKNSPGITFTEIDQTTAPQNAGSTVGAFAGPFKWGPVLQRVLVSSEPNLVSVFGKPENSNATYFFTAAQFLADSNALQTVRVVGPAAKNATGLSTGLLVKNFDDYLANWAAGQASTTYGHFVAKYPGASANGIQVAICDAGNFGSFAYASSFPGAPGTSNFAAAVGGSNDEIHIAIVDTLGSFGTPGQILERFPFVSKAADAKNQNGTSNYYADVLARQSAYVYWLQHPATTNWGTTAATTAFTTMSTTVVFTTTTGSYTVGEKVNVFAGSVTSLSVTAAGTGYTTAPVVTISGGGGTGATATATVSSGGVTGFVVTNPGSGYTSAPTVSLGGPGTAASSTAVVTYSTNPLKSGVVVSFNSGTHTLVVNSTIGALAITDLIVGASSAATGVPISVTGSTLLPTETLANGTSDNLNVTDSQLIAGYALFLNPDDVDLDFIISGPADLTLASYLISNIAEVRRDCNLTISPRLSDVVLTPGNELANVVAYFNLLPSSGFTFADCNWKQVYDSYNDTYRYVPCNGDTAGLMSRTALLAAPWNSPAGYNRGSLKNVIKLAWNPGSEAIRDVLYNNSINPIMYTRGAGPILFGDKTFLRKPSQFGHVNVRNLFTYIEKGIRQFARFTLFQNNTAETQAAFKAAANPFLRDIQGSQGILDFTVVCDSSNNTSAVLAANGFVADIYIDAAPSINNIQINMIGTPTGISVSTKTGN